MEDSKIIALYFARDEKAIAATAEKYDVYCNTIARSILENPEDARECVNDTYWNTWNAIPPNRPRIFSAFLGRITRNLAFNRYKHDRAEKRGSGVIELVLDELGECVSGNENVEGELEYKELVAQINLFLSKLPRKKRDIFVLRYWYAEGIPEIASKFNMTESAVTMTLRRLRVALKDHLTERGYDI